MGQQPSPTARKRPVFIANFRSPAPAAAPGITDADIEDLDGRQKLPPQPDSIGLRVVKAGLRYDFPPAGSVAEGGESDGYKYRITFAAGKLEGTYALIRAFLKEQGYGNVPLPADVEELKRFRLPPKLRHQLSLFGEDGYVHNPIKILFPKPFSRRGGLILELYDESAPEHLLKFHRR